MNKFIQRLLLCVQNKENLSIFTWGEEDVGFRIVNMKVFKSSVLTKYFQINNIASFNKQANLYNFKQRKNSQNEKEYYHKYFDKNNLDLVQKIERRLKFERSRDSQINSLFQIREKNRELYKQLQDLKAEQNIMHDQLKLNCLIQQNIQQNLINFIKIMIKIKARNHHPQTKKILFKMLFQMDSAMLEGTLDLFCDHQQLCKNQISQFSPIPFQRIYNEST